MGFFEDLGDGITGTLTFGQCDGGGCNGDHRGRGINPIGMIANAAQGVKQNSGHDDSPVQASALDFSTLFADGGALDKATLTQYTKPALMFVGLIVILKII